jgi:hypothetical protein
MDQAIRNKLRGVVTECRKLLEIAVKIGLESPFGIYVQKKDGKETEKVVTRLTTLLDVRQERESGGSEG